VSEIIKLFQIFASQVGEFKYMSFPLAPFSNLSQKISFHIIVFHFPQSLITTLCSFCIDLYSLAFIFISFDSIVLSKEIKIFSLFSSKGIKVFIKR
jgi:hypothetical protein